MDTGDASVEINDETRAPRGPGQVQEPPRRKFKQKDAARRAFE